MTIGSSSLPSENIISKIKYPPSLSSSLHKHSKLELALEEEHHPMSMICSSNMEKSKGTEYESIF